MKPNKLEEAVKKQLITSFCYYKGEMPDKYSSFWDNLTRTFMALISQTLKEWCEEVIGDWDAISVKWPRNDERIKRAGYRNELRLEQRATLKQKPEEMEPYISPGDRELLKKYGKLKEIHP